MKRNRLLYLALLALTALAVACTAEETFTGRDVQADSPSDCLAEGVYTYNLHFDLLGMTRAAGIWADGSQVEFFFYTEVGQTGYKGISGTATYSASGQSWTLTTSTKLPASPASTDCEARFFKPGTDPSNEFLTAVYYATGSYTQQDDTDVYADVTLKPCNWRLRFRGTAGTQLTLTATNIRHCTGDSLHAVNTAQTTTATIPLTVADDGYTSYIYGTLSGASTLTLTAGEEQYTRILTSMEAGKSFALDIPQKSDYASKGWTLVNESVDIEAIDLGLPSGILWANMNVGAIKPEDYGDYFAWGETEPKNTYNWSTYKYRNGSSDTMTKYCTSSSYGTVDNKTVLEASDDAATANWGSKWRMPTTEEQQELLNKCTWTWTTQNGVKGYRVTGTNGNSIFLPAAGYRLDTSLYNAGSYGYFWSSSLLASSSSSARGLYFGSDYHDWDYSNRYFGQSVRPVTEL